MVFVNLTDQDFLKITIQYNISDDFDRFVIFWITNTIVVTSITAHRPLTTFMYIRCVESFCVAQDLYVVRKRAFRRCLTTFLARP